MNRRTVLVATGFALSTSVAGCVGGNDGGASTPAAAVENYFHALDDGDRETANRYAHEDGAYHLRESRSNHVQRALQDAETIDVLELDRIDRETAARRMWYRTLSQGDPVATPDGPDDISDERVNSTVQRERADVNGLRREYGFDEYAYAWYEIEINGDGHHDMAVLLFQTGGQWRIWSPRPEIVWF